MSSMSSSRLLLARTDVTSPSRADLLRKPPARALRWFTASLALALAILLGADGVAAAATNPSAVAAVGDDGGAPADSPSLRDRDR